MEVSGLLIFVAQGQPGAIRNEDVLAAKISRFLSDLAILDYMLVIILCGRGSVGAQGLRD